MSAVLTGVVAPVVESREWTMAPATADPRLVALCEAEHPRLVGLLSLYTGDPWLADELAQEALVRLCAAWSPDGRIERPGAWLNRVAINLANSAFRRRAAARRAAARHGASPVEDLPVDQADAVAVRQAVASLPPGPREVIVLRYYEGWSNAEIADHLGIAESSARSQVSRAVARLREVGLTDAEEGDRS